MASPTAAARVWLPGPRKTASAATAATTVAATTPRSRAAPAPMNRPTKAMPAMAAAGTPQTEPRCKTRDAGCSAGGSGSAVTAPSLRRWVPRPDRPSHVTRKRADAPVTASIDATCARRTARTPIPFRWRPRHGTRRGTAAAGVSPAAVPSPASSAAVGLVTENAPFVPPGRDPSRGTVTCPTHDLPATSSQGNVYVCPRGRHQFIHTPPPKTG